MASMNSPMTQGKTKPIKATMSAPPVIRTRTTNMDTQTIRIRPILLKKTMLKTPTLINSTLKILNRTNHTQTTSISTLTTKILIKTRTNMPTQAIKTTRRRKNAKTFSV
jgi:hypothetical protein